MKKIISLFLLLALSSTFLVGCDRLKYPHIERGEEGKIIFNGQVFNPASFGDFSGLDPLFVNNTAKKVAWMRNIYPYGKNGPVKTYGNDDDINVLYAAFSLWIRDGFSLPTIDSYLSSAALYYILTFETPSEKYDYVHTEVKEKHKDVMDFQKDTITFASIIDKTQPCDIEEPFESMDLRLYFQETDDFQLIFPIVKKDGKLYVQHESKYYPIQPVYEEALMEGFDSLLAE